MIQLSFSRKVFLILLTVLVIFLGVLMGRAIASPSVLEEEILRQSLYRSISFDYHVYPIESSLYSKDTDPLSPGDDPYFTNLTEKIEFQIICEIIADDPIPDETNFETALILRSEGQWETKLPFTPEIEKNYSDEGKLTYTSSFNLPLTEAEQLCEAIVEETEVWPRSGYELIIDSSLSNPPMSADGEFLPSENPPEVFNAKYKFSLNGAMIDTEPEDQLFFEDTDFTVETTTTANQFTIFGIKMGISQARISFISSFIILFLIGSILYTSERLKRFSDLERMELKLKQTIKRYGNRIVKAKEVKGVGQEAIRVEITDLNELIRMADERERPIIRVASDQSTGEEITNFYLLAEEALYYYNLPSNITIPK